METNAVELWDRIVNRPTVIPDDLREEWEQMGLEEWEMELGLEDWYLLECTNCHDLSCQWPVENSWGNVWCDRCKRWMVVFAIVDFETGLEFLYNIHVDPATEELKARVITDPAFLSA